MNNIYSFRARKNSTDPYPTWKVIFTTSEDLPVTNVQESLAEDIGRYLLPTAVIIIVRNNVHAQVVEKVRTTGLSQTDWRINADKVPLLILGFIANGECHNQTSAGTAHLTITQEQFDDVMNQGLCDIFFQRGALIKAEGGQHFVHPSGKHSQAFIRAANAFIDGAETMFAAACLLSKIPPNMRWLWIDTSSISNLAYAFALLRNLLAPSLTVPTITSFSSWKAVTENFEFPALPERAVLISATTSGNLAGRLIIDHGFNQSEVITLFSLAPTSKGIVVCDLRRDDRSGMTSASVAAPEYREGNCPLCDAQSRPIRFVGDQFLADSVQYETVEILRDDAPKSLRDFMQDYYGNNAFGLRTSNGSDTLAHVDLDPKALIETKRFKDRFKAAVARYAPRQLTALVYENDAAGEALAETFCEIVQDEAITPMKAEDLHTLGLRENKVEPERNVNNGSVFVLAGSVGQGHVLDGISRDLRDPFGERPRTYLIGFSKHSHTQRSKQLIKNLEFNSELAAGKGFKHVVCSLESLVIPDEVVRSAWEVELSLLKTLIEDTETSQKNQEITVILESRKNRLLRTGNIAFNELFWTSPEGKALSLRDTFAFWTRGDREPSQGDVIFTIASVLENLRSGSRRKLVSDSFTQRVIDPGMFGRFNDGVIQASLLRCALPHELYYASRSDLSGQMASLILRVFSSKAPANEGSFEFLLAIACGRLRLTASDTEKVARAAMELPLPAKIFADRILSMKPENLSILRA
ncbi:hypothetical protein [Gluconobacter cerinus]|uniref:hypothetical protein n=1 Tax=Gluconobacter cerinus TaxID=38307 RepID=UPI001B8AFB81|nr:hypothetical protein [Gluconobacter cerinus]MBS1043576.1 hypothetical protein [Gluconobacter cerinus]